MEFGILTGLQEYQRLALITKSPSINEYEDLRHTASGLVTEVGEIVDTYKRHWFYKKPLDTKNLIEEIGDVLWYVAVAYHALDYPIPETPWTDLEGLSRPNLDLILAKLSRYSGNIFGVTFAYPEEAIDSGLNYDLRQLLYTLSYLAEMHSTTLLEAAQSNIQKLAKRYPEGFSTFSALNRNKENELSHILVPMLSYPEPIVGDCNV